MLDERELDAAIAQLETRESSRWTPSSCANLADLYIIRDKMFGADRRAVETPPPRESSAPDPHNIPNCGESDFLCTISGRDIVNVLLILDDLMDTLHVVSPRVYNGVMEKIRRT